MSNEELKFCVGNFADNKDIFLFRLNLGEGQVFSNSGCLGSLVVTWFDRKGSTRIVGLLKAMNWYAVFDRSMLGVATIGTLDSCMWHVYHHQEHL